MSGPPNHQMRQMNLGPRDVKGNQQYGGQPRGVVNQPGMQQQYGAPNPNGSMARVGTPARGPAAPYRAPQAPQQQQFNTMQQPGRPPMNAMQQQPRPPVQQNTMPQQQQGFRPPMNNGMQQQARPPMQPNTMQARPPMQAPQPNTMQVRPPVNTMQQPRPPMNTMQQQPPRPAMQARGPMTQQPPRPSFNNTQNPMQQQQPRMNQQPPVRPPMNATQPNPIQQQQFQQPRGPPVNNMRQNPPPRGMAPGPNAAQQNPAQRNMGGMRPPAFNNQAQQPQRQQNMMQRAAPPGAANASLATANIDPRCQCPVEYFATTTTKFPNSASLAAQAGITVGAIVHPLNEDGPKVPVVNFGAAGIIRCKRCRAYMNPFVQWHENGRRWGCNVCGCMNDTSSQYYKHLDGNGDRVDKMERPELSNGIVEIVAPGEYCVRPPQPPVFVFVIDVSQESVRNGVLVAVVETIKKTLDKLPGAPRTQVAFITYDYAVHFYNLKSTLNQPQMLVVSDIAELFLPVPEELLVNLSESRAIIDTLLDSLPQIHANNNSIETAFGPAIQAAFSVMSHIGGKMCVFQSKLPTIGLGKLEFRNNPRFLGTDKEQTLLQQAIPFYKSKALDLSRMQIAVELFMMPSAYSDIATLSNLTTYTGGQMHYYPRFNDARDGEALRNDLARTLTRETAWEAVLRIRASRGIKVTNFYGNFFLRGVDLLALPNCDADSTFGVEFLHEDKNIASGAVTIQMALLYTNSEGERRIRVSTNCIGVTSNLNELMDSVRQDEVCNLLAKQMVENVGKAGFDASRRKIQETCASAVRAYRSVGAYLQNYGQQPSAQNPLPENLKFLPLYTMSLQKSLAFRGGADVGVDERAALFQIVKRMSTKVSKAFIYPRMYELHNMPPECGRLVAIPEGAAPDATMVNIGNQRLSLPPLTNLSATCLTSQGAYLLDNGLSLYLWIGRGVNPDFVQSLFGVPSLEGIDSGVLRLDPQAAQTSQLLQRLLNIVNGLRLSRKGQFQQLRVIKEGEPVESRFRMLLTEDRHGFNGGSQSYQEYLSSVTGSASGTNYSRRR